MHVAFFSGYNALYFILRQMDYRPLYAFADLTGFEPALGATFFFQSAHGNPTVTSHRNVDMHKPILKNSIAQRDRTVQQ